MKIKKLLIANRGEIACRIIRTANRLGIRTVSIYSDADTDALHVRMADESLNIGEPPPAESYLNIKKILKAAINTGSDAIHPGYGFLSENTEFAKACDTAGIIFIGPSPSAIEVMGDKARAKRAMIKAGVTCIPGYQGEDQETTTLNAEAAKLGYPIMIKAAAGGGGKGMRLINQASDLTDGIAAARSEAVNAFGSGDLILEKAIIRPRHVEVQIFGDSHGNMIYLGERDCSVQRRHQKVIEEAPCPIMTEELRLRMGQAAVAAARAVDYVGAGTIEFLLAEDLNFYFLEMNTRLQVEHPVTELVIGLDLVELQLNVAAGHTLGVKQEDLKLNGHAIEIRLYAEDPANDFLPSTGQVEKWLEPKGDEIRVDKGIESGDTVSPYYDPMIAKVIAYGSDRQTARKRLLRAMGNSMLVGLQTNRDFLIDALSREDFINGQATTAFIADQYGDSGFQSMPDNSDICLAALTQYKTSNVYAQKASLGVNKELLNWATADLLESCFIYQINGSEQTIVIRPLDETMYLVRLNDQSAISVEIISFNSNAMRVEIDGQHHSLLFLSSSDCKSLSIATPTKQFFVHNISGLTSEDITSGDGVVRAPMHGQLLEVLASHGDSVTRGQTLAVLEAMKMQHEILSEVSGQVREICIAAGTQVALDTIILEIEPDET